MINELKLIIRAFGPLRISLILLVIVDMILRPEPGTRLVYDGWHMVSGLLAPVLSPILFMLLLLDSMMALVYRSDKPVEVKARYSIIVLVNVGLAIFLMVRWVPFFSEIATAY